MMTPKTALAVPAVADFALLLSFSGRYSRHHSFAPLLVFLLPVVVAHVIYVREVISPAADALRKRGSLQAGNVRAALPLIFMAFFFCTGVFRLVRFDAALGWSAPVCMGLSFVLCLGLIAAYGALKSAFKPKMRPPSGR